jgi:hypothetical protein
MACTLVDPCLLSACDGLGLPVKTLQASWRPMFTLIVSREMPCHNIYSTESPDLPGVAATPLPSAHSSNSFLYDRHQKRLAETWKTKIGV